MGNGGTFYLVLKTILNSTCLCTLNGKKLSTMKVSQWINASYMVTELVGWSVFYSGIMVIEDTQIQVLKKGYFF